MTEQTAWIDHIGISVEDFAGAKAFYGAALAPLGISIIMEVPAAVTGNVDAAGMGPPGKPFFWIGAAGRSMRSHIAFGTSSRANVDAFYRAALAAGAKDNGPPGLRPIYHEHYYGAFVIDPEGHNIEAVCHLPA